MAIKKQNRNLLILVVFTFIVLAFLFGLRNEDEVSETKNTISSQEQMGDQMSDQMGEPGEIPAQAQRDSDSPDESQKVERQKMFGQILLGLAECLEIKSPEATGQAAVQVETLLQQFQGELGPVSHQADRWMDWSLKTRDGKERRLRLEITENDEGKVGRELHYFAVDRDGQPEPIEIDSEKANNPSDEVINQMLKEGEVFYKERAAFALFPGGERLEYIEKDSVLSEIEFIKGEKYYRCHDLKARESCQCAR